ncbi:hypothetical protein NDU88_001344 [Pleurodeles waltl]|uniref:Uncharacterized protein n=1 Tax=Pleurodeles waltl TaxID=8319 RepID=A0AAV7S7A8_PLEWA|nr:hypothetical protein NDU88_001344 [Pleurodeles waltl]
MQKPELRGCPGFGAPRAVGDVVAGATGVDGEAVAGGSGGAAGRPVPEAERHTELAVQQAMGRRDLKGKRWLVAYEACSDLVATGVGEEALAWR